MKQKQYAWQMTSSVSWTDVIIPSCFTARRVPKRITVKSHLLREYFFYLAFK